MGALGGPVTARAGSAPAASRRCYLSAVLQALFHTPPLLEVLNEQRKLMRRRTLPPLLPHFATAQHGDVWVGNRALISQQHVFEAFVDVMDDLWSGS